VRPAGGSIGRLRLGVPAKPMAAATRRGYQIRAGKERFWSALLSSQQLQSRCIAHRRSHLFRKLLSHLPANS
jgi:hypothetical protein